jgi:oligopeptidase B
VTIVGWWSGLIALLVIIPLPPHAGAESTPRPTAGAARAPKIEPPVAARRPLRLSAHGIERVDDYAWLKDPNWREVIKKPAVLKREIRAHIEAENRYTEAVMAPLADLRAKLVREMKGRIQQDASEVPMPDGPYAYWAKFRRGAEHARIVRAPRDGGAEQLLLDADALASGKAFFSLGAHQHSPDHRLFAYLVDVTGNESRDLRVRDVATGRDRPLKISGVASFTWASDSETLFYVRHDAEHRARLVYRHRLGTDPAKDPLIYEEKDPGFEVSVGLTRTKRFIVISTGGQDTSESWLIDAAQPASAPVLVAAREPNIQYGVSDWGDRLLIRTNAGGADDFKIVTAPASAPGRDNWRDLIPYKEGRQILSAIPFSGYLARLEREDGLQRIVIRRNSDGAEHTVSFDAEAYLVELVTPIEFETRSLRFLYRSPATPEQTFDYDMESRERVLRKQQKIPSGHDPGAYVVRRLAAPTADNEQVPITILHRRGVPIDGSAPLYLEGYGAYAVPLEAEFDANLLSLVDRGFVYAIAHVRGGLEKGKRWHNAGRLKNKVNTFTDFIAAAEYLIKAGYGAHGRIVARGDSAGGTLVGAVANMRPDLFAGIVASVAYVDVLNSLLDPDLPLTASDVPEFGDPANDLSIYHVIAGYAPYDNVKAQAYPPMLVTAGLSDPRTQYWEPAKWVAKLRATKTNDSRIVLTTRISGHFGASGRFRSLEEVAMIQAFALDVTGRR